MRTKRMASAYIEDAEGLVFEGEFVFEKGRYHRVVRIAQEVVEFSLKAALRFLGIEYPKEHEVSGALLVNKHMFPDWFQSKVQDLIEISVKCASKRGISTYGNERKGVPASDLFTRKEAEEMLNEAKGVLSVCKQLIQSSTAPSS